MLPLKLAANASAYDIGAVICHVQSDGKEQLTCVPDIGPQWAKLLPDRQGGLDLWGQVFSPEYVQMQVCVGDRSQASSTSTGTID